MTNRITYLEQGSTLEIRIPTRKLGGFLVFLPVWLAGWTAGGVAMLIALISGNPVGGIGFAVLWLVMWACGWLFTTYAWLWMAFGREIIRAGEGGVLTVKRDVFGLGSTKTFPIHAISDLRAAGLFGNPYSWSASMSHWGLSGGTVAFDHDGKTHRFGIHLEEDEARAVAERLRSYLST
jgi:hypothetical protein